MKYVHPFFDAALVAGEEAVPVVVVESPAAFAELLRDIASSIEGNEERSMLFSGEKSLSFSSSAELLSAFFPFDLNKKTLLTKIAAALEKEAISPEQYQKTMGLLSETEAYLSALAENFDCNLSFSKISPASVIRSAGMEIVDDYGSLPEKILDYFELVREFEREKLFFTVNLHAFLTEEEADAFLQSVVMHGFSVVMFENREYPKSKWEKRLILDQDLCIIESTDV